MKLKLFQTGEPVLREVAREVTLKEIHSNEIQSLIDHMIETLRDAPGVGLAAPQVGKNLQIIIVEDKKEYIEKVNSELVKAQTRKPTALKVIINPKLTSMSTEYSEHFEGCLSVDGFRAVIPRVNSVIVSGLDRNGKQVSYNADGWFARILQHECDHLVGELYIDSMFAKTFMSDKLYAKNWAHRSVLELEQYIEESLY